jgi:hypothetical protein
MGRKAQIQHRKGDIMKSLALPIALAGFFLVPASCLLAAASTPAGVNRVPQPNIMNPAAMGTVPPSTYSKAGTSTQYDIYGGGGAGNLIVTGDVGSGKQFRGVVPYSSVNRVGAPTETSTYSNFMKATEPQGYGANPANVKPYYVPSQTVSKIPAPGTPAPAAYAAAPLGPSEAKPVEMNLQDLSNQYRPLSRTPKETVDIILKQYPSSQTETQLLKAINDVRQKELLDELDQIKKKAAELAEKTTNPESKAQKLPEPEKPASVKAYDPLAGTREDAVASEKPADIYDKMLQQLDKDYDDYMKGREKAAQTAKEAETATTQTDATGLAASKENISAALKAGMSGEKIDHRELNAKAYKLYMGLGDEYMKQKKFYKAAETYALSRTYDDKAESYAAQGWALLGTGEYMSSAYYLGRSVELDPNAASKKIDLAALLGSDTLAKRLSDLVDWQQKTYSGEMQFLLGYIYYEMGRTRDAEDEARAAAVKLADYRPASILKDVITGGK